VRIVTAEPAAPSRRPGTLIAFEGLDQSGKETQASQLRERLAAAGYSVELLEFPDYFTPIALEIERALRGERDYPPDVLQLLYIANRYEHRARIEDLVGRGVIVLCDRYLASSVAYGDAQGLDPHWLMSVQAYLPQPSLTILLDIAPEVAAARKAKNRDRFESDLPMLGRVRASYRRQAEDLLGIVIDAARPVEAVAADVASAVERRLGPP
jgi:dTMP kinase